MDLPIEKTVFVHELDRVLCHLYDPDVLLQSSFIRLFKLEGRSDAVSALQRILITSIDCMKPSLDVPPESNAWRFYHILHYRYTEQLSQREVAADLSISIRQVRRQESKALIVLADAIWNQYHLETGKIEVQNDHLGKIVPQETSGGVSQNETPGTPSRDEELKWLERSIPNAEVDLCGLIASLRETISPLLSALGVTIDCTLDDAVPPLSIHPMVVRQAFLQLLSQTAPLVPGGRITITASVTEGQSSVLIQVSALSCGETKTGKEIDFDMAQRLFQISGGTLNYRINPHQGEPVVFDLLLPVAAGVVVLVVDDNADTLLLMQRYLSGSRYRFIGVSDPNEVLSMAAKTNPQVIIMDVMLPGIDGWELLGRLKQHPESQSAPVIICSILPQEQLALSLGASGYLRKPVSREALLAELDQQMANRLIKPL